MLIGQVIDHKHNDNRINFNLRTSQEKIRVIIKPPIEDIKNAVQTIKSNEYYSSSEVYNFVQETIKEVSPKFYTCPAAEQIHHAYESGLLIHTAEVLKFANATSLATPKANRDLICAGATLHDIGKVFTYTIDELNSPKKLPIEKSIGHIYYSMHIVQNVVEKMKMPTDFIENLLHIIASHHGRIEYGAIKEPISLEAIIVSQADYLSAKVGMS